MKIKKAFINCDFRIMFFCLFIHFIFLWFSNTDMLAKAVQSVNSECEYWFYQLFLLCMLFVYFFTLIIYTNVLNRLSKHIKYFLIFFSLIAPLLCCIKFGTFKSREMAVSANWYGISYIKYLALFIVVSLFITVIYHIVNYIRKRS